MAVFICQVMNFDDQEGTMFVQFRDEHELEIVSVFCGAQNVDDYPNQGEIEVDDERLKKYLDDNKDFMLDPLVGA